MKLKKSNNFQGLVSLGNKLIEKLPPEDVIRAVESITNYKTIVEQEETKRKAIEKSFEETKIRMESAERIILKQIDKKETENLMKIEKTFKMIDKLIETGKTEHIETILTSLLNSDTSYINEETANIVQDILNSNRDEFVTVRPIEE